MNARDAGGTPSDIKQTPLHDLHVALGARMVPFAGYSMPVQYPTGILKEHQHTRKAAGLFDVSHMGQFLLRAESGDVASAARALEQFVPADILALEPGRQRYTYFTTPQGGIGDDFMVANRGDALMLVVNAGPKAADQARVDSGLPDNCALDVLDRALLALQGPKAEAALAKLAPDCTGMGFMDVADLSILGEDCTVSRSGYTGEDGFEISVSAELARPLADKLLSDPDVLPVGLGARDSLRLEAGLPLYGSDIDETTTPVEADLAWAIQKTRGKGGARAGGFPGADLILGQIEGGTSRMRVGLRPEGRAPIRAGAPLFANAEGGATIGSVTSGGFGPTVDGPVAMGYVATTAAEPGTRLFAELRGKRQAIMVAELPFVPHHYKRR
ncbi:MAG: glycine cleavage system aminomethyltransferase GcvT [Pseudomonadota bacterium]